MSVKGIDRQYMVKGIDRQYMAGISRIFELHDEYILEISLCIYVDLMKRTYKRIDLFENNYLIN